MTGSAHGFAPPTYPYDRLGPIEALASRVPGGVVDLSIGTPCDPPPDVVLSALASSGAERGYPPSAGSARLLDAARGWMTRRFGVVLDPSEIGACIGTKEFVAGVPHWLRLRRPERDTVLYPAVSYPTYEMGALLASCRACPVPVFADGRLDLLSIPASDARRALCLWLNSPANPTGALDDLGAAASWGRVHDVPVLSDECYAEYSWSSAPRSILEHGTQGVLALHSISKRSNCAGLRVGFYAGDRDLVHYLVELRRHAGFMVPGPEQAAGAASLDDDAHVVAQRDRYWRRLERVAAMLEGIDVKTRLPDGGFYLWVAVPDDRFASETHADEGPEWGLSRFLARTAGILVSPGEFYGRAGSGHVRIAVVQPDDRIELARERLRTSTDG